MAGTGKVNAALAKLARDREAIAAQAAALDLQEIEMRRALAREGIATLSAALGKLDLGEVTKGEATRFAKRVQQLGLTETLARLEAK